MWGIKTLQENKVMEKVGKQRIHHKAKSSFFNKCGKGSLLIRYNYRIKYFHSYLWNSPSTDNVFTH